MKSAYLVAQGHAQNMCLIAILTNFLEIRIPLCNDPIGLIQKGHLKTPILGPSVVALRLLISHLADSNSES